MCGGRVPSGSYQAGDWRPWEGSNRLAWGSSHLGRSPAPNRTPVLQTLRAQASGSRGTYRSPRPGCMHSDSPGSFLGLREAHPLRTEDGLWHAVTGSLLTPPGSCFLLALGPLLLLLRVPGCGLRGPGQVRLDALPKSQGPEVGGTGVVRAWSHWARNAGVSCWGWWQMPGREPLSGVGFQTSPSSRH